MVSGYSTSTSIPRVDGLSTGTPGIGVSHLQSLDLEVWKTILSDYTFPTKYVDANKIKKTLDEYNEEENIKFQLNYRAIYIPICVMDRNEYNRISPCKTTKEVWRILEITH